MGYNILADFSHHLEDRLSILREHPKKLSRNVISSLLRCQNWLINYIDVLSNALDEGLEDPPFDSGNDLLKELEKYISESGRKRVEDSFGNIAVESGIVKQSDIEQAIVIQNKKRTKRIGEILVEQGKISEEQRDQVLNFQKN